MRADVPRLLVDLQYLAAGLTVQLAVQSGSVWYRRSNDRASLYFALFAASLSAALVTNVWLFTVSSAGIETALLVRSILLIVALGLIAPTLASLSGQRVPRWGMELVVGLGTLRLGLWIGTDLVFAHRVDANGLPVYGPLLDLLTLPYLAVVVGLTVSVVARWDDVVERAALMAGTAVALAVGTASLVCSTPAVAELLTGYWIIPWIVALQVVCNRRMGRAASAQRALFQQRERAITSLAHSERRTRLALQAGGMAWYEWRPASGTFDASPELANLLGVDHSQGPMTFDAVRARVHPEDRADAEAAMLAVPGGVTETAELRWVRTNGTMIWVQTSTRADETDDREGKVVGIVRDITYEKLAEIELLHRTHHDDLTGLANRSALNLAVGEALAARRPFALLVMDLDRFKDVNDTLGHTVGDRVLVGVGRRLSRALAQNHRLARLGGDEFAVLVPEGVDGPERVAARMLNALQAPIDVDGVAITVRASIGIVCGPADGHDADTLVRRADAAMYRAKQRGGTWHLFTADLDRDAARRLQLASELPEALVDGQIEVHYQPTIALPSLRCRGLEALVRWRHREHGLISPVEFVPLAEQYGLGPSLARHVLADALSQCRRWRADGLAHSVAVNVSPHTLLAPAFAHHVEAGLRAARLPCDALVLELTENVFAEESGELLDVLHRLKRLGVGLAIDDFGTGYSSLAYLRRLPVDTIKLDRSFTAGLGTDAANDAIVSLTVEMAHRLGLTVVAEGVETHQALDALHRYRCDLVQGYLICRPSSSADITRWLADHDAEPRVD